MTYSFQNLQDFVLNLLNDEAARSAYAADPTGALSDAGLGDLTPQDVQEVVPLVTDALPSETPLGDFAVDATGVMDGADAFGGSLGASNGLGDLGVWGVESGDGGMALWGGSATDLLGRVAGGVSSDGEGLAAAATTPLGYADFDTSGNYHVIPADPTDVVGNLGNNGDSVAGTVTHMANTGALSLSDGIENGGDALANALGSTPAGPLVGGVESATDMAAEDIEDGAGLMAEQAGHLPSADAVPATLPAVPDLPEVPGLGGLGGLPVQVPELDDLPVSLPELPVATPDTGAVTDVLQNNPVSDAVSNSPVGGLADTARGAADSLPVGDLTDDLNLGL
ncbi:MAG: IniB N-terminal domain-containing protein [Actinophytocola sp.]|uniref:IniB N-terminal domain-containing protein n=1 Tax=Actinophytocola sp. TaxID=1872138 RepID=UPI003D6BAC59